MQYLSWEPPVDLRRLPCVQIIDETENHEENRAEQFAGNDADHEWLQFPHQFHATKADGADFDQIPAEKRMARLLHRIRCP